jgi:hypothetical protein
MTRKDLQKLQDNYHILNLVAVSFFNKLDDAINKEAIKRGYNPDDLTDEQMEEIDRLPNISELSKLADNAGSAWRAHIKKIVSVTVSLCPSQERETVRAAVAKYVRLEQKALESFLHLDITTVPISLLATL